MLLYFAICISWITFLSACRKDDLFCNLMDAAVNGNRPEAQESEPKMVFDVPVDNIDEAEQTEYHTQIRPVEGDYSQRTACESEMTWFHTPTHAYMEEGGLQKIKDNQRLLKFPVLVERCKNLDKPCSNIAGFVAGRLTTKCTQKYINVEIQLNDTADIVKIPTACVCSVTPYYV